MGELTRRAILLAGGGIVGGIAGATLSAKRPSLSGTTSLQPTGAENTLNDASGLNETPIFRHTIRSENPGDVLVDAIRAEITEARENNRPFNIGAARHSMGGHGALTIAMNLPDRFASVSAFAPICNPMDSDWGRKQLGAYLGPNTALWEAHDASVLMRETGFPGPVLIDTGTTDQFGDLLKTEALAEAIAARRQPAIFRMQPGYDHSYFFISTFMEDHIGFHAEALYGVGA